MYWNKIYKYLEENLELSHGRYSTISSMEGLRGIAVLMVFIVHFCSEINILLPGHMQYITDPIIMIGLMGVDLFFVLSGFLIYGAIIRKDTFQFRQYIAQRINRIYPTFLVVLAMYLLITSIFPQHGKLPETDLSLYILQNILLLPGIFPIDPIMTVAWSLSYEALFYILIPIVIISLKLKTRPVHQRLLFWVVTSIAYLIISHLPFWREAWGHRSHLVIFIAGIIVYELYEGKGISLSKGGTTALIAAIILAVVRINDLLDTAICLTILFILLIVVCLNAFDRQSTTYKWLVFTPLRWLGNMSYSYFLIHPLILKALFLTYSKLPPSLLQTTFSPMLLLIPTISLTLLAGYLLFITIERPLSLTQNSSSFKSSSINPTSRNAK